MHHFTIPPPHVSAHGLCSVLDRETHYLLNQLNNSDLCFHTVRSFGQPNNPERGIHSRKSAWSSHYSQLCIITTQCDSTAERSGWRIGSSRNISLFHLREPVATAVLGNNVVPVPYKSTVHWECASDQSHPCLSLVCYGSDSWPMPKLCQGWGQWWGQSHGSALSWLHYEHIPGIWVLMSGNDVPLTSSAVTY